MALNLETIADKAAKAAAKEIDEHIPDGFIQAASGEMLVLMGKILMKIGVELAGAENNDGDK